MLDSRKHAIGSRIKQARERAGLSQYDLARQLGITAGAVGLWEIGRTRPTIGKVPVLAKLLAVTPTWLLGDDPPQASTPSGSASTTISVDTMLANEARDLGIDVPAAVDSYLRRVIAEARQQRWLTENRAALADANAFLDRYGLWSEGKRLF